MPTQLLQTAVIASILASTLRLATPLLLAALGEMVTERSGVMNLGVEGMMLLSAFTSYVVTFWTNSLLLGLLAGAATGGLMALLMAFMAVTLKVEQIVTGMALNLLGAGLSVFLLRLVFGLRGDLVTIRLFDPVNIPVLSDLPIAGPVLFGQRPLTYLAFLLVPVIWFFMYRTKYGLQLRAVGESPKAVDTKGVNVARLRYLATIFGGLMAGLAGAALTLGASPRFVPGITAGRGWLAIVIVIAGQLAAVADHAGRADLRAARCVPAPGAGHRRADPVPDPAGDPVCLCDRRNDGQPGALGGAEPAGRAVRARVGAGAHERNPHPQLPLPGAPGGRGRHRRGRRGVRGGRADRGGGADGRDRGAGRGAAGDRDARRERQAGHARAGGRPQPSRRGAHAADPGLAAGAGGRDRGCDGSHLLARLQLAHGRARVRPDPVRAGQRPQARRDDPRGCDDLPRGDLPRVGGGGRANGDPPADDHQRGPARCARRGRVPGAHRGRDPRPSRRGRRADPGGGPPECDVQLQRPLPAPVEGAGREARRAVRGPRRGIAGREGTIGCAVGRGGRADRAHARGGPAGAADRCCFTARC